MLKRFSITLLFIIIYSLGYGQKYLEELKTTTHFQNFCGLPISAKYGQIDAVKVVYDLPSQKLYYLNAENFEFHHEFCGTVLKDWQTLGTFNDYNYSQSNRRKYLLGNINYVHNSGQYFLELSPSDLMTPEQIKTLHRSICATSFLNANLAILINSNRLNRIKNELKPIPVLNTSSLFSSLEYQAIYKTSTHGNLKFISDINSQLSEIQPKDIIVLNETPLTLPMVAGIIISEFQTPLSHITLLGQNRRIPIIGLKNAFQNASLQSFNNQQVYFNVRADSFEISSSTKTLKKPKPTKVQNLKFDLSKDSLLVLDKVHRRSYIYIGNKAYNFSELVYLSRNSDFKTPESAFAIPFSYYQKHIEESNTQALINKLLFYKAHNTDIDSIKIILREIRNSIRYYPLDKTLEKNVTKTCEALGSYSRFRFRSSTNAEDMDGFSGAGLYASKTGIINNANKPIDEAIKKVWASLWSFPAFMERENYGINQRTVYMGILVHRSFPKEQVNGVAITKNLYRDSYFGYVVNAQKGNENVVKPSKGTICDQIICYPTNLNNMYDENKTIEIITTGNMNNNELVMNEDEIRNLANQLYRIKQHFYDQSIQEDSFNDFAMDVEFKLDGINRQLYIKQARKFNP
ncbi:MAG: PEP/pyruvate-binding domain-containing protein [Salibacteraceae bacterium]